jgi:hypothetical protein
MLKHIKRYQEFISQCKSKFPHIQLLYEIETNPKFNPQICPQPRQWFLNSFEWYIALKLVPGASYGPFYRIDGEHFWPQIGNNEDEYSERKCFFGMKQPKNDKDVASMYNIQQTTNSDYVYELIIEMPKCPPYDAYIFLGPVAGGTGFQVNPNSVVVDLIRCSVTAGLLKRFKKESNGFYDYKNVTPYYNSNHDGGV